MNDIGVLCIDDRATDSSADILANYAAKDARVKLFSSPHAGAFRARAVGVEAATGEYIYFMPEFLTERTYIEDFKKQPMVFTGEIELLCSIFKGKTFTTMTPLEAEITKYAHNVFGAYKVTYFNAVYDYCRRNGADWARVHAGMLLSGYIDATHTFVPVPDGKFGDGGKCFPKDVNAFAKMTEGTPLGTLLAPLHELNVWFRGYEERI